MGALSRLSGVVLAAALIAAAVVLPARGQDPDQTRFLAANTCQEWRDYLAAFPNGQFRSEARQALRDNDCPDPETDRRRAEQQAQRDREAREAAQRERDRLAAEAAAEQRRREEAERTAQRNREAAAAAEREQERLAAENARLQEQLRQRQAFSTDLLHPQVRDAVLLARAEAAAAETAAAQARSIEQQAQAAAAQARAGAAGYLAETLTWGEPPRTGRLETQVSGGRRNGLGVLTHTAGPAAGDVYAGQWRDGVRSGFGVYCWAENATNRNGSLRYEGECANDRYHGRGVYFWRNGDRYAGGWRDGAHSGYGVYTLASGQRNEGAWASGAQNGAGVIWRADGTVLAQGIYENGTLATPLSP